MKPISEILERPAPGPANWLHEITKKKPRPEIEIPTLDELRDLHPQLVAAKEAARKWAKERREKEGLSFVMHGPVGIGKTHIAKVLLWTSYLVDDTGRPLAPVNPFYMANDLFTTAYENRKNGTPLSRLLARDFVVIDDMGTEMNLPFVAAADQAKERQQIIFAVIDFCYQHRTGIVINTNLTPGAFKDYVGDRAYSRLQEIAPAGFMVNLPDVPDYRRFKGGRS